MKMQTYSADLLTNGSATGDWKLWPGGRGQVVAVGTFGGASLTLEQLGPDGTTAVEVKLLDSTGAFVSVPITAANAYAFELPDCQIRIKVTGGTPSGLYVKAGRTLG